MAKVSAKYETIFIADLSNGEEKVKELIEKIKALIEKNATVTNVDEWGKRSLAYAINDMTEGYYTLIEFEGNPSFPAELDRVYKITEGVMRSIIVCKDEEK